MRRLSPFQVLAFGLLSMTTCAPSFAATTSAPADEYFGRYHLSILGIRNAVTDMTIKAHEQPDRASAFLSSAQLAEDSIHQWQAKYPQDAWLPKMIFSLERLYVTIGTQSSAEHAVQTAAWLDRSFPKSEFAQMGHTELASLSTSDDGNASTPDSPAMLGMVPALTDTTEPERATTQIATAQIVPPTTTPAVTAQNYEPRMPSYALPDVPENR